MIMQRLSECRSQRCNRDFLCVQGWTDEPGGTEVKYELNSQYTVNKDQFLYIVRRTALRMTFCSQSGASNSTLQS